MFKFFAQDRSGATAVIFGVATMVVMLVAGGAVDYGRMLKARSDLQAEADVAALYAANSTAETEAALLLEARKSLSRAEAVRYTKGAAEAQLKFTNDEKTRFVLKVPGKLDMTLLNVLGLSSVDIGVETEVERGSPGKLELALVLDNTGSMDTMMPDGKTRLQALKSSASTLIKSVGLNPKADVKIAVVPFTDYVNVGLSNRNASWINVPPDSKTVGAEVCKDVQKYKYVGCVKKTGTRIVDGMPQTYTYNDCTKVPDKVVRECSTPTSVKEWRGCVGTRPAPNEATPDVGGGSVYPGLQNVSCASPLTPLTANNGAAQSAISTMKASGSTYIPAGLLWGINVLTPAAPFDAAGFDASGRNMDPRKVMVLMTDGENTRSLRQPWHNGSNKGDADALTAKTCATAKGLGIEVFTVAFDVTDASTKAMLQACATDAAHYFDASGASGLEAAFQEIGDNLRLVRVTR